MYVREAATNEHFPSLLPRTTTSLARSGRGEGDRQPVRSVYEYTRLLNNTWLARLAGFPIVETISDSFSPITLPGVLEKGYKVPQT